MLELIDELGRRIFVQPPIKRVVSLVPSLTEWLFAIGVGERVVGVTQYCVHPAAGVADKPKLRGTKNPDRVAIIALQPDLVIANQEENRERDVLALEQAGIAVYVTRPHTVQAAIATLARLAALVDASVAADPLIAEMEAELACAPARKLPVQVVVPIWREPWLVVGQATYTSDLLRVCGGRTLPAIAGSRYPQLALERIPQLAPDAILLPSEPYHFTEADLPPLRAVFNGPIHFVDGELLTWYGPRIGRAISTFRVLFE